MEGLVLDEETFIAESCGRGLSSWKGKGKARF